MKKKSLLFLILSFLCIGLVSGCGEEKFSITTEVEDSEAGYAIGGGTYVKGSTVNLRVYVNAGCTFSGIDFTKKDSSLTERVNGIEDSPDKSYKYYDFAVTDDTIGNYKAIFDCSKTNTTNKGSSTAKNRVKFYIVKMEGTNQKDSDPFGLRTDASSSDVPYVEVANNALIGEIKNSSGTVITTNIRNVPKYQNQKFTWYKCNSFENYNTPVEKDKFDSLTMKISANTNLCGFGTEKKAEEEVKEGIESFVKNSKGMVVTSGEYSAHVKNLFNISTPDSKNRTYIKIFTNGENEKIKGLYSAGTYYEYTEIKDKDGNVTSTKVTSLEIMKETNKGYVNVAGIELKNISDLYKYIKLMDLKVTSATKDSNSSKGTVYKVNNGEYFITIDAGGQIVGYKDSNNDTYTIKYVESFTETSVAKPKDTYIIQLSSNNTVLNGQLNEISKNYDTAIKISQGYGETIQKQLAKSEELQEKLKIYSYTWKVLDDGDVCSKDAKSIADAPEYIEETLRLCAYVPENSMSIIEMNDYLNKIQTFDTNIKITYLGDDHTIKTYTEKSFDSTVDETDSVTGKLFGDLKNIANTFTSFSYNELSDSYVINVGSTSLTVKFGDVVDGKRIIEKIDYRAEDGMKYTYVFSNFTFNN